MGQEYLAELSKQSGVKDFDPLLPVAWVPAFNPGVTYEMSADAHGGKKSLKVIVPRNSGGQIAQQAIEVAPRGAYTFGLWCKGTGKCAMRIVGLAYEGGQELGRKEIVAGPPWTRADADRGDSRAHSPGARRGRDRRRQRDAAGRRVLRGRIGAAVRRRRVADRQARGGRRHAPAGRL